MHRTVQVDYFIHQEKKNAASIERDTKIVGGWRKRE
jgi:hypothetical protein